MSPRGDILSSLAVIDVAFRFVRMQRANLYVTLQVRCEWRQSWQVGHGRGGVENVVCVQSNIWMLPASFSFRETYGSCDRQCKNIMKGGLQRWGEIRDKLCINLKFLWLKCLPWNLNIPSSSKLQNIKTHKDRNVASFVVAVIFYWYYK
jgi:hypothetical protein